jgi:hypothetical protein
MRYGGQAFLWRYFIMSRIKKLLVLTVISSCALAICPERACSETATKAESKLQQVALFKNGLGFFISEVIIPDNNDSFSFVPLAAASHGTFWVSYPAKVQVKSLAAEQVERQESLEAITMSELLKANVGRRVKLWPSTEQAPVIGTIKYFAENRDKPIPDPYAPGRATDISRGYIPPYQPLLMIVETDTEEVCINPQSIHRIDFIEDRAEKTFSRKSKSMQLAVKLDAPAGGQKLTVSYLAKGTTWVPSYIVDISNGDKALLAAKAVVINEACDLNTVTLQLVTGFPHLKFADVVSPLALKENLAQFLQSLIRGESERGRRREAHVMAQSAEYYAGREMMAIMPEYGAAEAGKVSEDLFFYPVENVQLKKGQVGYYPLFTESVLYKHIYQWNIPDYVNEQERYVYGRRREQEREPEEEVWHCLRLQNSTKVPWTTAPAETVKEGLILGQDTLNYTPVKGETTLKITQAVSVKAEQLELEIDRKREALRMYGDYFDLITVQGKLSVTNFQDKSITLEIVKALSGEVKSSQPQAQIESLAKGLLRMNAVRKLTWTIELKPGDRKELSYIYEVYVRR